MAYYPPLRMMGLGSAYPLKKMHIEHARASLASKFVSGWAAARRLTQKERSINEPFTEACRIAQLCSRKGAEVEGAG